LASKTFGRALRRGRETRAEPPNEGGVAITAPPIFPPLITTQRAHLIMDWRNRIGLYGSYFLGMAAIGFTLPYLPLYLGEKGLSDRAIGIVSTLAALSALAQFPVGLWSDRIGWRKPFLVVALATAAVSTVLLREAHGVISLGFLVILFAENGVSRAVVESLSGAEAASLAPPGGVGAALGALRFWKPIGIVLVALLAGDVSRS
jgi:MFS family permease